MARLAEPTTLTDLYHPWPKQAEGLWLLGCTDQPPPDNQPVNLLLWGGQAGPGKSMLLRMIAAYRAITWPGSHFAIFRKKSDDVIKNHVDRLRLEIPEHLATYNHNRMEFRWFNGSVTECHHCYEDNSHEDYKGYEWGGGVGVDESTDLRHEALGYFFSRIRMANEPRHFKTMVLATNPGGRSHVWHKMNFVDGHQSGVPFLGPPQEVEMPDGTKRVRRFRHCLLKAELKDNPSLDYEDVMAGLLQIPDELQRRAQAFGDWDLPSGQFFETFDRSIHVCAPFDIPDHWPRWRGLDYADAGFTVCLWAARNPKTGQVYIYREWIGRDVPLMRQPLAIKNLSHRDPPIKMTLADPSMNRKNGLGLTPFTVYANHGVPLTKANNKREFGWARIKQALSWDQSYGRPPELQIFEGCTELIRQLANIERSTKPGDWADIKEPNNITDPVRDDAADSLRYLLCGIGTIRHADDEDRGKPRDWKLEDRSR